MIPPTTPTTVHATDDEADAEVRTWLVEVADHGQRLDRFLAQQVQEFSRSHLQQLIADGLLVRNGQPCTKAAERVIGCN